MVKAGGACGSDPPHRAARESVGRRHRRCRCGAVAEHAGIAPDAAADPLCSGGSGQKKRDLLGAAL